MTAQSRRLQDKAQPPRHRYRTGIGQSAEGDEPALCFYSAPSVSAPFPPPVHHCALRENDLAKGLRFAGCWCMGTKPKSRDEIIAELSSVFIKNPSLHGMDKQEAQWMAGYTANLMKTDKNCHLLVDASKSTQRKDTFYIDCNDHSGNSHRYWVSRGDLIAGNSRPPAMPVSEAAAVDICNTELRSKATNPATYNPSLLTGTTSRIVKANGRNVVEIDFSAKSAIGVEGKFRGRCILESGRLIDATVENR